MVEDALKSQAKQTFTDALPLIFGTTASDPDTHPYAYLNYLIFDEQFNPLDAGAMRVPETAGFDSRNRHSMSENRSEKQL